MAEPVEAVPFRTAVIDAWADLFGPRDRLLRRWYASAARRIAPGLPDPETLDRARDRFFAVCRSAPPAAVDLDRDEDRMALGTRLVAAWLIAWTCLLPALVLVPVGVAYARSVGPGVPSAFLAACVPLAIVLAYPILAVVGLGLQALFRRPFRAALRLILGHPNADWPSPGG